MSEIEMINVTQDIQDKWNIVKSYVKFYINRYVYTLSIDVLIPEEVDDINDEEDEDEEDEDNQSESESESESEQDNDDDEDEDEDDDDDDGIMYEFGLRDRYYIKTTENLSNIDIGDDDFLNFFLSQGNE